MLETVLEPAINAPRLPIQGETKGHMPSNACAAEVANTFGMARICTAASGDVPELINTCTIGTENSNAGAAASMVLPDSDQLFDHIAFHAKIKIHKIDTNKSTPPGE